MDDWTADLQAVAFFLLVVPLLYYIYWRVANRRVLQLAAKIPGPPGLPLLGNLLEFSGSPTEIFESLVKRSYQYEDVIKIWFGPRLLVFLTNPQDIEILLSSTEHIEKSIEYEFMKPWLGDGLLISSGQKWFSHRKVIAQTFHLNVLRSFLGKFNENAKKLVKNLAEQEGNEFDCRRYMCKYTAETLIDTVMGADKDKLGFESPVYSRATTKLCELVHLRHTKLHFRSDILFNSTMHGFNHKKFIDTVHDFSAKVIKFKKSQSELLKPSPVEKFDDFKKEDKSFTLYEDSTGISYGQSSGLKDDLDYEAIGRKKKSAFLDTLLEKEANKEVFSMKDIQEQIDTLMFEGHDTTAGVSSMFLCLLATHPDIQAKCVEELQQIFGDSNRDVTFEDTYEMKYLERCIMETLRIYSPVPVIARNLKKELKIVTKNITLPVSTTAIVTIFKLHRREDLYPNAEKFNPDNFIKEKTAARNFYSFIPFSAGPRSCVGRKYAMLKLKVVLSTILRNYQIATSCPMESWKLQADITLKRTDGFKIKLIPRKST
ncbi:cytochrome P450 4g15 [Halyomorpha halys]|uniref:cytochrome P450 4g15 n=1 Tax=Halyomorpha halys TaxID=286706 RepID=UPI0006D4CF1D|nr:cytochrome P450 4g15 [Halyomorpha halys]